MTFTKQTQILVMILFVAMTWTRQLANGKDSMMMFPVLILIKTTNIGTVVLQ